MTTQEQMLVIGAGPVGLAFAKALKDRNIPYIQAEADDDVGGNWYHGVYETAHIISSRKTTEYADFPMPEEYPDFPSREQLLTYFRSFADTFGLREHIRFNTRVVYVRPAERDLWEVTFSDQTSGLYKGVVVCNGHHWDRKWPEYPGEFKGEWIHSKDYKQPAQLEGKRVLVIGGGNSACDVASEAARVGKHACISMRQGYWFLPKTMVGVPAPELLNSWTPVWVQRLMTRAFVRFFIGRYSDYGLPEPDHRIFDKHPTVSTEILHYLKHGRLHVRPEVKRLEGRLVEFSDGRREEFDMVVCATGFHVSFPFLAPGLVEVEGPVAKVYGGAFVPKYRHLYITGTTQPRYGLGPLVTPASQFYAEMILLQDKLTFPIGSILKEIGQKPPDSHLLDPMKILRQLRMARRFLPKVLPRRDKKMAKKYPAPSNPTQPAPLQFQYDMQVY